MIAGIATLDGLLQAHAAAIGADFAGYRNHAYRVANVCAALSSPDPDRPDPEQLERIAIAAAFHDIGIWTDGTFDYLEPSVRLASAYLARSGRAHWMPEIAAMIREHHKILPYRGEAHADPHSLVEPFRRADWVDVSRGAITFGLPRPFLRQLAAAWPSAGFHARLVRLSLQRLRSHPLSPLPMMRL